MKKIILILIVSQAFVFSQESWVRTTFTFAPSPRTGHSAVWTGNRMIVWGGQGDMVDLNTGGIYDVSTDSWTPTSTVNAPERREEHMAVWTGSRMIIWGGMNLDSVNFLMSGGLFDPGSNTWTPTSLVYAPIARVDNSMIWTGSKMIVWGGFTDTGLSNQGKCYDPNSNTWTGMTSINAPTPRFGHSTVWTGSKMIIWGGDISGNVLVNTGGIYDQLSDTWAPMSTINAPVPRDQHTAVWTGSKMIVWGGSGNDGGIYDPVTDSWEPTSQSNAPQPRYLQSAIWTGIRMIVWGGVLYGTGDPIRTGGIYDPFTDSWAPTSLINVPIGRVYHTAIWTDDKMIIWGGVEYNGPLNSGGIYFNPNVIGIQSISSEIPNQFSLSQNYPNPFNPTTKIKFDIPPSKGAGGMITTLSIYDALGREVAMLVNQELKPGTYEVTWDASSYPSGVYFYRFVVSGAEPLTTQYYSETRKMVLVK